jgi:hypothetical protein
MKFILEHPDKPWDWEGISRNPNITMNDILEHPELPWNWYGFSSNTFGYINEKKKKEGAKRVADLCREHIMQWCWNPETVLGRYLVTLEMMELYQE